MDVLELRLVAVAQVVDDQVAALESDFGEVAAIEAERTETVEPGEEGGEVLLHAALVAAARRRPGAAPRARRDAHRGERRRQRPLLGAGRNRDPAVGFDPDRELGADEVEPFGARDCR